MLQQDAHCSCYYLGIAARSKGVISITAAAGVSVVPRRDIGAVLCRGTFCACCGATRGTADRKTWLLDLKVVSARMSFDTVLLNQMPLDQFEQKL